MTSKIPLFDLNNEVMSILGISYDISERIESENRIKNLLIEFQSILDATTGVSIIRTDINGLIDYYNTGAEKILGYNPEEIIKTKFINFFHDENELSERAAQLSKRIGKKISNFEVLVELANNGMMEFNEWSYVNKKAEKIPVILLITAIKDNNNEIIGYLNVATDITERKIAEKLLLDAQSNLEKIKLEKLNNKLNIKNLQLRDFAHITSHNLRSPVGNLNSLFYLIQESDDIEEKEFLFNKFEVVIKHLSDTLNTLVDSLKIRDAQDIEREELDVETILNKVKELISVKIQDSKAVINTDFIEKKINYNSKYLESLFLNLLTNSIKYSDDKRKLEINIKTFIENDKTVLTFQDNGLGINLERNHDKIFKLNKTFHRHPEAKGVGLYLTKLQVENMGGTITVESEVDKGTIFKIIF